jgi:hypothetical protein
LSKAAQKRRIDPEPEPVDLDEDVGQVLNKVPGKVYQWAYKVGDAIATYESRGYDVVLTSKDGPRPLFQRKGTPEGVPVEWKGNVLMDIDEETHALHYARGQRKTDLLEKQIVSPDGPADPSRGIHRFQRGRTAVGIVNTTSEAVPDADLG